MALDIVELPWMGVTVIHEYYAAEGILITHDIEYNDGCAMQFKCMNAFVHSLVWPDVQKRPESSMKSVMGSRNPMVLVGW